MEGFWLLIHDGDAAAAGAEILRLLGDSATANSSLLDNLGKVMTANLNVVDSNNAVMQETVVAQQHLGEALLGTWESLNMTLQSIRWGHDSL